MAFTILAALALALPGPTQALPSGQQAPVAFTPSDAPQTIRRGSAGTQLPTRSTFLSLAQGNNGDMPRAAAFTADGNLVLVVNRDTDSVTVFDFATRAIVATIPVGDYPLDVKVSPDGSIAAVPNTFDDTVSLIDIASLSVVATVPVSHATAAGEPYRVEFNASSTTCIVGLVDGASTSRFSVIDVPSRSEVASIPTSPQGSILRFRNQEAQIEGDTLTDFAVSSDASFVLLPDPVNDRLNSYALPSGQLLSSIALDRNPAFIDLSDDDSTAVLAMSGADVRVRSYAVTAGVPSLSTASPSLGGSALPHVRLTPDGQHAFVASNSFIQGVNGVKVIELATGQTVGIIRAAFVGDIEFTFDDRFAVITSVQTYIVDLSTFSQVATVGAVSNVPAAVSPVSHRMVGLNNRLGEDVHFYSTDGITSLELGRSLSGEEPDIDAPRRLTTTPDGRTAIIVGNTSRSVVTLDLATETVTGNYAIGDRGWDVDTDAAGTVAVVTSAGDGRIDVIDLVAGASVATLDVDEPAMNVQVTADGTRAYVATAGGDADYVYVVDLAGSSSSIIAQLPVGRRSISLFAEGLEREMELSPDESTLAVSSFLDFYLFDTATLTRRPGSGLAFASHGCAWSPDGQTVYTTEPGNDLVVEISLAGPTASVGAVTVVASTPYGLEIDEEGEFLYVACIDDAAPRVSVIRTLTMQLVRSNPLPGPPLDMVLEGNLLLVSAGNRVNRVLALGATTALVSGATVEDVPGGIAFSPKTGLILATQPGQNDGVSLIRFGGIPSNECGPAVPNSTGQSAEMQAEGTFLAGGFPLTLRAVNLPPNTAGFFLHSRTTGFAAQPGGSQGNLCLGGQVGRLDASVLTSGAAGQFELRVDTLSLPNAPAASVIMMGDLWSFQAWYRDANPMPTSNFSDRLTVRFE